MIRKLALLLFITVVMASCLHKEKSWEFERQIELQDNIQAIGIAEESDELWLSDPDNNRLVKITKEGEVIDSITGLQRPMHITFSDQELFIPEYVSDTIRSIKNGQTGYVQFRSRLDAPSAVAVQGDTIAVADFYNHRVILKIGNKEVTFSKEGHNKGELYYPTDIAIYGEEIYVADAYNHRVQVFDSNGNVLRIIGAEDGINVATGITVYKEKVFVTDFYNNRVLIYNTKGIRIQIVEGNLSKPADVLVSNKRIYIANYGSNMLTVLKK
ncbi:NHL repeat-containing protein [Galbibacter sp. EGI 63066]|uniref:NHL repeat-containing protein n=1 Tax=Galbibacter sp. EGI 63066 TaxID=2993559 RepID=UPI002248EA6C|nr:NHL repeat-containing protein [Galbibacter sp. EGI 63066]MCX2678919.1 NHL repeat-containing protein [Galbibacter sp. EGI 63066]